MNKTWTILIALLLALLAGGYGAAYFAPKDGWPGWMVLDTRVITVSVDADCHATQPAALDIRMGYVPFVVMRWQLDAPTALRWDFVAGDDGIALKNPGQDPNHSVFYSRLREAPNSYRWHNANAFTETYPYKLNLVNRAGTACTIDPFIINHS